MKIQSCDSANVWDFSKTNTIDYTHIAGIPKATPTPPASIQPELPTEDVKKLSFIRDTFSKLVDGLSVATKLQSMMQTSKPQNTTDYETFKKQASAAVRRVRLTQNTTLEGLMASVQDTNDPRLTQDLCDTRCYYVGKATKELCRKKPHHIISLCANMGCERSLCFEMNELAGLLQKHRKSGNSLMKNPAFPVTDAAFGDVVPHFDTDTVQALELHVMWAKEREAFNKMASVDETDRAFLWRVVLPSITDAVQRSMAQNMVGNLIVRFTNWWPVQGVLWTAKQALLWVLEHPILSSMALVLAKVVRTVACFWMHGIDAKLWTKVQDSIFRSLNLDGSRYPWVSAVWSFGPAILTCVAGVVGGPLKTAVRLAKMDVAGAAFGAYFGPYWECVVALIQPTWSSIGDGKLKGVIASTMENVTGQMAGLAGFGFSSAEDWFAEWRLMGNQTSAVHYIKSAVSYVMPFVSDYRGSEEWANNEEDAAYNRAAAAIVRNLDRDIGEIVYANVWLLAQGLVLVLFNYISLKRFNQIMKQYMPAYADKIKTAVTKSGLDESSSSVFDLFAVMTQVTSLYIELSILLDVLRVGAGMFKCLVVSLQLLLKDPKAALGACCTEALTEDILTALGNLDKDRTRISQTTQDKKQ